jgi:hypothetical protein
MEKILWHKMISGQGSNLVFFGNIPTNLSQKKPAMQMDNIRLELQNSGFYFCLDIDG